MSNCKYCNNPTNAFLSFLFGSYHKECKRIHKSGKIELTNIVLELLKSGVNLEKLDKILKEKSKDFFITDYNDNLVLALDNYVDFCLTDKLISKEEQNRIEEYTKKYNTLDQSSLNSIFEKIVKSKVIEDIVNGNELSVDIKIDLPIILSKDEKIIWAFTNVDIYTRKTKVVYEGKSSGTRVRLAKGVYHTVGKTSGTPMEKIDNVFGGNGQFILTTKHLYFYSKTTNFKIPFSKIEYINPENDGIVFKKTGVSFKPFYIDKVDGWFVLNVVSNLQN